MESKPRLFRRLEDLDVVELDDRYDVCVVRHVALQDVGVWHEGFHEGHDRIENKMRARHERQAHARRRYVQAPFHAYPAQFRPQKLDRKRHVDVSVIIEIEPGVVFLGIEDADADHK